MTLLRSAWLAIGIAALLAAITLPAGAAGTGQRSPKGAGACATAPRNKPKGEIRISDLQFPTTLNTNQTNVSAASMTGQLLNDSLLRYDRSGHLYPVLLSAVPTRKNGGISHDGKTIRLHLKHGLTWSNGARITAHQIWFAWKIGMDRASGPACLGTCDKIASIGTPGTYDAVIRLKQTYASAVPRALPGIMVETWHNAADSWTRNNFHQAAVALYQNPEFNFMSPAYPTTGPYRVTDVKQFDHITLEPNPLYSNMTCGARVARITFQWYPSREQLIAAAAKRQTDITTGYQPADLPALKSSAGRYKVYEVPGFAYEHLELNVDPTYANRPNPLSQQKVRQALALAVNKAGTVKKALGVSTATARQIVAYNPWVWRAGYRQPYADRAIDGQWDPIAKKYVQSGSAQALRDARTLLNSTRWKAGFSLDAVTNQLPARQKLLNSVTAAWAKLGVKLTVGVQSDDMLFSGWGDNGSLAHGKFQVALFTWVGSPDPESWLNEMGSAYVDRTKARHSDLNQNYSGFKDRNIDRGFRTGASTFNGAARAAAYRAVQTEMNRQAYWIGIYYRDQISTSDGKVKHFAPNPTAAGVTWNAYNWST